ncbi:hypothetical protein [Aliiglaciecola lipolytica]|uniref:Uncharacterized protein n=1 Tax=Aliiglaciecola lipolytica E3 TaxID=1127673 RepID=K6YWW0_9ALTE|nr:hypothetical protein [Aliiglaciecola lipolytica]GAC15720.1 hypothetical protein GLIP_3099 [Aliiglaciecola lipolytica E3]
MKKLIVSLTVVAAILSSAVVIGQTEQTEQTKMTDHDPVSEVLETFAQKLQEVDRTVKDRNSRLRLERALYYYQSSIQFHQSNWNRQALDHARRGLRLLELSQQQNSLDVQIASR